MTALKREHEPKDAPRPAAQRPPPAIDLYNAAWSAFAEFRSRYDTINEARGASLREVRVATLKHAKNAERLAVHLRRLLKASP